MQRIHDPNPTLTFALCLLVLLLMLLSALSGQPGTQLGWPPPGIAP